MSNRMRMRSKWKWKPNRYDPNNPSYAAVHGPAYLRAALGLLPRVPRRQPPLVLSAEVGGT